MTSAPATADKSASQIANENPLAKFDGATLKAIGSTELVAGSAAAFVPSNMAEAMEMAKLMAASNFVPPHLRGKPGDCLAVVMQSARWEMDPFAVANKSYFVNDRAAYESQLVISVINLRGGLLGKLQDKYSGEWPNRVLTITGTFRSDPNRPKSVEIKANTITTRNSPLWKQQPDLQLYYFAARAWGRLHCPEVLLGVLTVDELQDAGNLVPQADGSYRVATDAPPPPTRSSIAATVEAEKVIEQDLSRTSDRMPDTPEECGDVAEEDTGDQSEMPAELKQPMQPMPAFKWVGETGEFVEFTDPMAWIDHAMTELKARFDAKKKIKPAWDYNAKEWDRIKKALPTGKAGQDVMDGVFLQVDALLESQKGMK